MPRPLSVNSRKVLAQLGKAPKSVDELSARTGIRKDKLAKVLWHLEGSGWIAVGEETRQLPVYRRLREPPAPKRSSISARSVAPHLVALDAAFGIRRPSKRLRARTIRKGG